MKTTFAMFLVLFTLCAIIPAIAQSPNILYDNGPVCPGYCHSAWQINDGYGVSDSFFVSTNVEVNGFDFWTWEYPGDKVLRVQWSITSAPFGGTVYGSGANLVNDVFQAQNEYGYDIDKVSLKGLGITLPRGTYYFNLQNIVDVERNPVYWDENSGEYCHSPGCPSSAVENQLGTIPSETFDIRGVHRPGTDDQSSAPEADGGAGWGPVLVGLAIGLLRFAA